ncbi:MAG: hypothetical protein ACE5OY_06380 [Candidatus Bathyarchaeia archaeon]
MVGKAISRIVEKETIFSHTPRRMLALRDCPEIKMAGLTVGPYKKGELFEIEYSIGGILERDGIAKFDEEFIDPQAILKIHWKESVQKAEQLSTLPPNFYPLLRHTLDRLRRGGEKNAERLMEYQRIVEFSKDIVNCRLRKIIRLAAVSVPEKALESLTPEEKALYDELRPIIRGWKSTILGVER